MASKNTLRTNSWDTVYTYLQTTNPISTDHIYSSLNSKLINDVGYPFVIIESPLLTFEKETANGVVTNSSVSMLIRVQHTSAATMKALVDDVSAKLLAGRYVFSGQGLKRMNISEDDYQPWQDGDKKIHETSFSLTFRFIE